MVVVLPRPLPNTIMPACAALRGSMDNCVVFGMNARLCTGALLICAPTGVHPGPHPLGVMAAPPTRNLSLGNEDRDFTHLPTVMDGSQVSHTTGISRTRPLPRGCRKMSVWWKVYASSGQGHWGGFVQEKQKQ